MEALNVPLKLAYSDLARGRRILRKKKKITYLYDFGTQTGICIGLILSLFVQHPLSPRFTIIALFGLSLILGGMPLINRLNGKRAQSRMPELSLTLNDEQLVLNTTSASGTLNSGVFWRAIEDYVEDEHIFFWLTKGGMLILPKRDLSIQTCSLISDICARKVNASAC